MKLFPTLGERVRALRHGFNWNLEHGCYFRLSRTESENVFRGEICPAGGLVKPMTDTYVRWWGNGADYIGLNINQIQLIAGLIRAKRAFVFYFGHNGQTL